MSTVHTYDKDKPPSFWTTSTVLQWLLGLALVYTLYFAKTLLIPLMVALMLTLLLGPLVTFFKRFYVPRIVSTVVLLALLTGPFTFLALEIGEPMQRWAQLIPELSESLAEQMESLQENLSGEESEVEISEEPEAEASGGFLSGLFGGRTETEVPVESPAEAAPNPVMDRLTQGGMELAVYILSAAPTFLAQLISCLVLTIFLLVFGSGLFESAITHLPQIHNKKRAYHLVAVIEAELSRYILTVSIINSALGGAVALAFWLLGIENALLWGVLIALLNFAPYIGTFIGVAVLLMAGLAQYGLTLQALTPALVYFVINALEAQFVTPTVLGIHMRINPLILMAWLIFWAWLWGFIGVLIAVPLLVCIKLAAKELEAPPYWTKVIETQG